MELNVMLWVGLILLLGMVGYYVYLKFWLTKGKGVKLLLFEKIGDSKLYRGEFQGEEKKDKVLGAHIKCLKIPDLAMDLPPQNFFFPGRLKTLMICKYGIDDYRPMHVIKDNEFTRTYYEQKIKEVEEVITDPKTGVEEVITVKELVFDKNGQPEMVKKEEELIDPIGITMEGREVMRFAKNYHKRMEEMIKEKESFWDKNSQLVINATLILAFFIIVLIINRVNAGALERANAYWADQFGFEMEEARAMYDEPGFIGKILDVADRKKTQGDAPPGLPD